jgi:hypothetical protein
MPPRRRPAAVQPAITCSLPPLIKNKMALIGQHLKVKGSHWAGRMSDEEKNTLYVCAIRDFQVMHEFEDKTKGNMQRL